MVIQLNTRPRPKLVERKTTVPQQYSPHTAHLNLNTKGEISSKNKFRELLFIAISLASFMEVKTIQSRFEEVFHQGVAPSVIRKVQVWMEKMRAEPNLELKPSELKWREIYEQFVLARKQYVTDFTEEPLAYPKGRFEELKKLYQMASTPVISRVVVRKEHLRTNSGKPRFVQGKALMLEEHIPVAEAEVQTAANILKQMGQETGTFVEQTKKTITIVDRIKEIRHARGLPTTIQEAEFQETE